MFTVNLAEVMLMQILSRFEYGFFDRREEVKVHRRGKRLAVEAKSPRQAVDSAIAARFTGLRQYRPDVYVGLL